MKCEHNRYAIEAAVLVDGMCPLCLADEYDRLKAYLPLARAFVYEYRGPWSELPPEVWGRATQAWDQMRPEDQAWLVKGSQIDPNYPTPAKVDFSPEEQ